MEGLLNAVGINATELFYGNKQLEIEETFKCECGCDEIYPEDTKVYCYEEFGFDAVSEDCYDRMKEDMR